jgi:hypothetical protein
MSVINDCRAGRSQRATGKPAIIIVGFNQSPAFMGLALDMGFGGFTLCVEQVKSCSRLCSDGEM